MHLLIYVALGAIALSLIAGYCYRQSYKPLDASPLITIGILQTASHPALDRAREGFVECLRQALGQQVTFITQNAEGSMATAHAMARSFHANQSIRAFCALGTMATQVMAHVEKKRLIAITAVSDAQALGVIHPGTNVCGTTDEVDADTLVDIVRALVPSMARVALLYSPSEMNAVSGVKKMETALRKHNIAWVHAGISSEADITPVIQSIAPSVDAILVPTDNTVACALGLVARLALKAKKPLILSFDLTPLPGVLASVGVDYTALGYQAGQMAFDVVKNGKRPDELLVQPLQRSVILVHKQTASVLGVSTPEAWKEKITLVE